MRIPRIFTTQELTSDTTLELESGPSQHVARVLRLKTGNELTLFDGQGLEYRATIIDITKKQVRVSTGKSIQAYLESPLKIHLGVAISRGERMDWVFQKATELGVAEITPLFTERTEVKLTGERAQKKLNHWRQVVVSACEQCGRNRLPDINELSTLDNWLDNTEADLKLVLHHRANTGKDEAGGQPACVALLVGPEGGLSASEIDRAENKNFQPMKLGPRILRTETAPLAAIAILQSQWGDMQPL